MSVLVLVIEIVSPGTGRVDRGRKRELYQRSGVPEYWVVDVDARTVEAWHARSSAPIVCADVLPWQPAAAATPLTIDLPALFADVAS